MEPVAVLLQSSPVLVARLPLNRRPRSLGATTGHIVRFEDSNAWVAVGQTRHSRSSGREMQWNDYPAQEFDDLF